MTELAAVTNVFAMAGIPQSMADDSRSRSTPSADERDILRRIGQGETERFADLIRRYQGHVLRIVGRRVPSDRVEEVVHDVFVRAYLGLKQFAGSSPFDHWLAGIAVRCCYEFWRTRSRAEVPVSALTDDHHRWIERTLSAQSEEQFKEQSQQREAAEVLEWALSQLSPAQRAILTLVYLDGYTLREAGDLLGWSLVNVKVRAYRARQAMRKVLTHRGST